MKIVGKRLEARWDIKFHGIFKIGSGRTAGHFKSGTVHALERLSRRRTHPTADSRLSNPPTFSLP